MRLPHYNTCSPGCTFGIHDAQNMRSVIGAVVSNVIVAVYQVMGQRSGISRLSFTCTVAGPLLLILSFCAESVDATRQMMQLMI